LAGREGGRCVVKGATTTNVMENDGFGTGPVDPLSSDVPLSISRVSPFSCPLVTYGTPEGRGSFRILISGFGTSDPFVGVLISNTCFFIMTTLCQIVKYSM
jgi:hypothetical protein